MQFNVNLSILFHPVKIKPFLSSGKNVSFEHLIDLEPWPLFFRACKMDFIRDAEPTTSDLALILELWVNVGKPKSQPGVGFVFCLIKTSPLPGLYICVHPPSLLLDAWTLGAFCLACSVYAWILANRLVQTEGRLPATVDCFRFSEIKK